jgi:hypothetical protein
MTSTWKNTLTAVAIVAVLSSQISLATACPRRKPAAPAVAPVTAAPAPVAVAPVTVASETAPASAPSLPPADEQVAAAPIDLELYDIRQVDNGNDTEGPAYRLIVKNLGRTAVTTEITFALLASMEKDSDDNLSVLGSLDSLEAGATKSVELRLPKGAETMTYLTAVVAASDTTDADETDNIAVYERNAILAAR